MIRTVIFTPQTPYSRGFNDFYPILKWRKQLKEAGYKFSFVKHSQQVSKQSADILWVDYRWIQRGFKNRGNNHGDRSKILVQIERWKLAFSEIHIWDSGDSSGSRCFWLTPYVDKHIKKQILKDRKIYLQLGMANLYPWVPTNAVEDDGSYVAAQKQDLSKLCIGWNIGMIDYRKWPLQYYWPIGQHTLLNSIFSTPIIHPPNNKRSYLVSYRGGMADHKVYAYQRNKTLDVISRLVQTKQVSGFAGGKVKKSKYLKELRSSQLIVSPFGWGEVCYRDFETFIVGSALVKPRMDHLDTYPNIYRENETYFPVEWDMSNLEEVLMLLKSKSSTVLGVAEEGQRTFVNSISDFTSFKQRIQEILN